MGTLDHSQNYYFSTPLLTDTMQNDPVFGYGFIATKNVAKCVNATVTAHDVADFTKRITIKFSEKNHERVDSYDDPLNGKIKYSEFKQMNSNLRHDLKNKLIPLLRQAKTSDVNSCSINYIEKSIDLLDSIKIRLD
ncbi:MAG: hypothetical protein D3903_19795 [Candidatus Electrothrix sp. GM3_4]|nr:hypothetical protein [Candidatus Electrothrix sp. GM3_4]